MPIEIIRDDITRVHAHAIVNAANESLLGGGGVDGAIHRAAGPELLEECRGLHGCRTGSAKITRGYRLPAKYVIHTVGPVWRGGSCGEEELLISCYKSSLALAKEYGCESVAFPLISAGVYGYPREQALRIAMDTIRDFLLVNEMLVYIVIFDKASFRLSGKLYTGIAQYIDDHYVDAHEDAFEQRRRRMAKSMNFICTAPEAEREESICAAPMAAGHFGSIEEALRALDESFTQMLLRRIDEKGMKDSQCYKRANIDRKLFSKIRSDLNYKPSKRTAVALAIALEMDLEEMQDFLGKAGYTLSHSSKFDLIIEYCVLNGVYDINTINEHLFDHDQLLLGA